MRWVGEEEVRYSQEPHLGVGDPQEDNHNCRGSSQGERGPSSTSGSPARGSCTKKTNHKNIWL